MNENQKAQKAEAMRLADHHNRNSNVVESRYAGTKEGYKKDIYYHQDRDEYLAKQEEYRKNPVGEPPSVPGSMMEEEYENGVHKGNKHAPRHKEYNK